MGALVLHNFESNTKELRKQLDVHGGIIYKLREVVEEYLLERGIYTLDELTLEDVKHFKEQIKSNGEYSISQRKRYASVLEQIYFAYKISGEPTLKAQLDVLTCCEAIKNKTGAFMLLKGLSDASEITYESRCQYEEYLVLSITGQKVGSYVKALDQLKLNAIKKENEKEVFRKNNLKYACEKIFLLYHPSYELAMTFYYVQDKQELVFDFSHSGFGMLKRQILNMLNYVLEEKEIRHDRRERFLVPLKKLYEYCLANGIEDIEQLTDKQIQGFRESMDGKVGSKTDTYMQIVDNIRKYLFLSAKSINWDANVWYLEKFNFKEGRVNPAREVKRITFAEVESDRNRVAFKNFMKYEIGVAQGLSVQSIRCIYYGILAFMRFLDEKNLEITEATAQDIEEYIKLLDSRENQPESYNKNIVAVERLFGYLVIKKHIEKMPLPFEYYLKKTITRHNDRAVSEETEIKILFALKYIPYKLRLMYLNLWCIGIRINEVCVIRGNAYSFDGENAWIKIYQNKMRCEKCVPIPKMLYDLMMEYIADNDIKASDYVFQNRYGGAFCAGTFSKQFKNHLRQIGIVDYDFKSHDFRHTLATKLYRSGASIEAIRDYLGHRDSKMTRQYLDYFSDLLDAKNEKYFSDSKNKLS